VFTGLIEEVARVARAEPVPSGLGVIVSAPQIAATAGPGDSIAVNGVCLTVESVNGTELRFHVGAETVARTTASSWRPGRAANLERALRADSRLGGHFVQGHVDCTGRVATRRREGQTERFTITLPPEMLVYVAPRGSVAVDGISLTVTETGADSFAVAIIPFTSGHTSLADLQPGDAVNIEVDILARYIEHILRQRGVTGGGITGSFLAEHGFA
jgi:riboflavin synthase